MKRVYQTSFKTFARQLEAITVQGRILIYHFILWVCQVFSATSLYDLVESKVDLVYIIRHGWKSLASPVVCWQGGFPPPWRFLEGAKSLRKVPKTACNDARMFFRNSEFGKTEELFNSLQHLCFVEERVGKRALTSCLLLPVVWLWIPGAYCKRNRTVWH